MSKADLTAEKILNLISRNRISSVEVADALNKKGVLDELRILNPGHFSAGRVKYVYTYEGSNYPLHEQIVDIPENAILYVDCFNCDNRALFGDIVAKYLNLYKKTKAIVVNGLMRDAHRLRKEDYPIWLKGVTPLGCVNKKVSQPDDVRKEADRRRSIFEGSVLVCDDSGCTMITREYLTDETLKRLEFMELQEDIWYFCIDTLKMSTFDTICLKKYLNNRDMLPENLRSKLSEMEKNFK